MEQINHYASLSRRFAAYLIDHLLTALLMSPLILWYLKGLFSEASGIYLLAYSGPVLFLLILIRLIYLSVLWTTRFGTIGCHLLSICVCTSQGNKPSYAKTLLRYLVLFCSTCLLGLGWISILFTEKRQALCDLGAKTVVMVTVARTDDRADNALPDTPDTLHNSSDQGH
nr:RDD family protein [uncultured Sphaerochaeta sp.]